MRVYGGNLKVTDVRQVLSSELELKILESWLAIWSLCSVCPRDLGKRQENSLGMTVIRLEDLIERDQGPLGRPATQRTQLQMSHSGVLAGRVDVNMAYIVLHASISVFHWPIKVQRCLLPGPPRLCRLC